MRNHTKKLIAVLDSNHLITYIAEGLKILEGPNNIELSFSHHARPEKDHGSYGRFGHNVSQSDPHTTPKEIDNQNAAKLICGYLDKLFRNTSDYNELILVADPRMLGTIRENLPKQLEEKVTIEIHKNLVKQGKSAVEHAVFS
jgi:protein required for attachment to host cells